MSGATVPVVTTVRPFVNAKSYVYVACPTVKVFKTAITAPEAAVLSYKVVVEATVPRLLTVNVCNAPAPDLTVVVVAVEICEKRYPATTVGTEFAGEAPPKATIPAELGEIETTAAGSVVKGAVEAAFTALTLVPSVTFIEPIVFVPVGKALTVTVPDTGRLVPEAIPWTDKT